MQVALAPETAFPYSKLVNYTCFYHPELMDVVIGQFYAICPYAVPLYPPRREGQSDIEYYVKELKYKCFDLNNPNTLETTEKYTNRMMGIVRLYFSFLILPDKNNQFTRIREAWYWITRVLNLQPRDITADILVVFLEMTGSALMKVYRRQFMKLLVVIEEDLLSKLPDAHGPSYVRLENFLRQVRNDRGLPPPKGFDIPMNIENIYVPD